MFIEVKLALDVVIGGTWKPSRHMSAEQWEFEYERRIGKAQHWGQVPNYE
jgi:hypothetical protein